MRFELFGISLCHNEVSFIAAQLIGCSLSIMSADFWAGYISGAAGILIGNPLDLIKVRLQAGPSATSTSSASSYASNFSGAGSLIRGETAPILGYGALNALLFVTYNRTSSLHT